MHLQKKLPPSSLKSDTTTKMLKQYKLNIADIIFSVNSDDPDIHFKPEEGFCSFIENNTNTEVQVNIKVKRGKPKFNTENIIFDVPAKEDGSKLWTILSHKNAYCLHTFLQNDDKDEVFALFGDDFLNWEIYYNHPDSSTFVTDPFAYPLGPIIIMYAAMMNNGVMIHASAVNYNNDGYLFCGFSGRGKTTISRLFSDSGAQLINDDRIIIRKQNGDFVAYNTPMHYTDKKKSVKIKNCFLIHHASANQISISEGAKAMAQLSALCLQHNYNEKLISAVINLSADFCSYIPVYNLGFFPDKEILDFIEFHFVKQGKP